MSGAATNHHAKLASGAAGPALADTLHRGAERMVRQGTGPGLRRADVSSPAPKRPVPR
jgi:hypothetical protein